MGAGEAADHCSTQGFTSSPITSLSQGAAIARNRKRWKGPFLFQEQAEKGFCLVHPVGSVLGPRCQGAGFPPLRTVWGPVFPGPLGGHSHWQPWAGGPHSQPALSPHRAPSPWKHDLRPSRPLEGCTKARQVFILLWHKVSWGCSYHHMLVFNDAAMFSHFNEFYSQVWCLRKNYGLIRPR